LGRQCKSLEVLVFGIPGREFYCAQNVRMNGTESVAELRAIEQQCLERFRSRAAKLAAANPGMSRKLASE
jgi:hypothetical protein